MDKWCEIFKAGTHTDSEGRVKTWSEGDLDNIVKKYDPAKHESPVVIGHPKDNAPAFGWVESLRRQGTSLLAKFRQVVPQFAEAVKQGLYKKRSISLYPDGTLRHVGFLGAQPPAIKGLADFSFSDEGKESPFNYEENYIQEENSMTIEELQVQLKAEQAKNNQLQQENDKLQSSFAEASKASRKREIETLVDKMIAEGRMLPTWKANGIVDFMNALADKTEVYEFAEGQKLSLSKWFTDFISSFSENELLKQFVVKAEARPANFAEDTKLAEMIAGSVNEKEVK
ncbi:MAG: hypothetical protein HQM10_26805 [Candidatus Riflebacteria bacterium]|nr:hypothetical protein [Candidatus Riflebacteria bacterium]